MAISEIKMQIVIANYFERECSIDTSIRQAFEKGFRIGVEKGASMNSPQEWIPCKERLPKDLEVVNITWVNHRPMTYYADIKDEPFTATAIHYKDKWWWYSPICEDMLAEYGKSECDKMDADIEVTAWMPLPKPWKGETMNLILKGIDLPDKKLMEMFESDNHICIGGNYYPLMIKDVIQIPKDHGRLIDAKLLADTINKAIQDGTFTSKSIWEWIADAPTILEAEE